MQNLSCFSMVVVLLVALTACEKDDPETDPLRDYYEFVIIAADTTIWEAQVLRLDGTELKTVSSIGQESFYTERTENRKAILKLRIIEDSSATVIRTSYRDLHDIFEGTSNLIQLDPSEPVPYELPNDTIDFANL